MSLYISVLSLLINNSYATPSFKPNFSNDESFSESYTAVADLENGTYMLLQMLFSNAGFGDQKAICRVLVVPKGSKGYNHSQQVGSNEWKATDTSITIDTCSLEQNDSFVRFTANVDNISASL